MLDVLDGVGSCRGLLQVGKFLAVESTLAFDGETGYTPCLFLHDCRVLLIAALEQGRSTVSVSHRQISAFTGFIDLHM